MCASRNYKNQKKNSEIDERGSRLLKERKCANFHIVLVYQMHASEFTPLSYNKAPVAFGRLVRCIFQKTILVKDGTEVPRRRIGEASECVVRKIDYRTGGQ